MNVASWADAQLEVRGDFDAFVFGARTYGSAWCHDAVCRLAQGFASSGIAPGDRVVLLLPNVIEHVLARWAVLRAGAVGVAIAPTAAAAELERIVDHSGACAIVAAVDLVANAMPAAARVRHRIVAGEAEGWTGLDALVAANPPMIEAVPRAASDLAQITYTSGVSSAPKGVMLTHGSFEGRAELARRLRAAGGATPEGPEGTVRLAVLPFAYSWGSSILFAALREKTRLVCLPAFEPEAVLSAVERQRVERMALVPPMCEALIAFPKVRQFDLSSLKSVEISGAPVPDDLLDRFESALRVRPVALYGLTEHAGVTMASATRKPGSSGRVRPGVEARIVDAGGHDLPAGEAGELLLASPVMAAGYYKDPETTARTFRDGWLHTGDLARLDHDRDLYIVGRVKELIIQGGVNVHPSDVVDVLSRLDGVRECAVVGVPNPFLGEEVTACVVRAAGADVSEEAVLAFCRRHMDIRKAPTGVRFLPELPRTSAGKVRTADLRAQIVAERAEIVKTDLLRELERMEPHRRRPKMRAVIFSCLRAILPDEAGEGLDRAAHEGRTFGEMGISSLGAVMLANALSHRLGRPLSPTITFSHVTVDALADHLTQEIFDEPRPLPSGPKWRGSGVSVPIAVVGIGCRLPGNADGPAGFWELLKAKIDATTDVPRTRFDVDPFYDPVRGALGKTYVRRGAFIAADEFDAEFFGLGPREAEALAPEHRLLLEVTWEALEHAGYHPFSLAESMTSVFLGMTESHYGEGRPPNGDLSPAVAAGRVSHFFNLRGPSVAIDTACSSSLVAVHQAVHSLRRGESDMAIAAGVKVTASASRFVRASEKQIVSADGRTRTFDAEASGTSLGEGCVAVVLKRLEDAEGSGDRVLAIIRGTAINNDGRSASLAAPNGKAQEAVIRAALSDAAVPAREVDYLEAHGTATILGDPIELQAAVAVYGEERESHRPLIVGSVKTNIGHLEAGAGLAGLVKAVLALQHREIPASLNFTRLNPVLAPLAHQVEVPTESRTWPESNHRRRLAAVTSMGISGTNSHVILEEAPEPPPTPEPPAAPVLLTLSARSTVALEKQAARYAHHLAAHPEIRLSDVCATAALGRNHFEERLAVAASSREELESTLTAASQGDLPAGCARGRARTHAAPRLAFLFPGQGAQYAGMGRTLYDREPVFHDALDRCAAVMDGLLDRPLLSVLFSDEAPTLLDETAYAQPAIFAVAVSLAQFWRAWGIEPDAVVGQSQGEIAAACAAGALSLEDAAKVVCRRSRLVRRLRGRGAMAVVGLPEAQTRERLAGRTHQISIAVTNGSASTVVSGDVDAVQALLAELESEGVFCRRLKVDYSSHSHHVDDIRGELSRALAGLEPRDGMVPLYSTVTVERLSGRELDAEYWGRNLREPVRFASLMTKMVAEGFGRFVEVSTHPSMGMAIAEWIGAVEGGGWVPSLRKEWDDRAAMFGSLGELYVRGVDVDWNRVYAGVTWRRAELPTYAFQRRRYWRMAPAGGRTEHLAAGPEVDAEAPPEEAFGEQLAAAAPEERNGLLVARLRTSLSGLLGDVAHSIPAEASLLAYGMNSLRIMSFLASVQRGLQCICLPADFISRPSLEKFAAYLEERLVPARPVAEEACARSAVVATAPQLVVLRAEGARDPIFCSHPAGGETTAYLRLRALLDEEHPLYAVQSRACHDPDGEHTSLQAMAADYANIVEGIRPGPYVLVGWSMGAVLSHAIAAELERRGRQVRLVAMIDPPYAGRLEIDDIAEAVRATVLERRPELASDETLSQHLRGLTSLPGGSTADLFKLCEEQGLVDKGTSSAQVFDAMVRLRIRHFQLVRAHRPGVVRADMAIWWAKDPGTTGRWSSHTCGHVSERFLGGLHYTIMLPPRIEVIANDLRTALLSGVESLAAAAASPSPTLTG